MLRVRDLDECVRRPFVTWRVYGRSLYMFKACQCLIFPKQKGTTWLRWLHFGTHECKPWNDAPLRLCYRQPRKENKMNPLKNAHKAENSIQRSPFPMFFPLRAPYVFLRLLHAACFLGGRSMLFFLRVFCVFLGVFFFLRVQGCSLFRS